MQKQKGGGAQRCKGPALRWRLHRARMAALVRRSADRSSRLTDLTAPFPLGPLPVQAIAYGKKNGGDKVEDQLEVSAGNGGAVA